MRPISNTGSTASSRLNRDRASTDTEIQPTETSPGYVDIKSYPGDENQIYTDNAADRSVAPRPAAVVNPATEHTLTVSLVGISSAIREMKRFNEPQADSTIQRSTV